MRGNGARTGALLLFAGAALAAPSGATAKTYHPTTTADHAVDGCTKQECTLREAIIDANARFGPDTIVLNSGRRYRMEVAGDDDDAAAGDLDVAAIDGKGLTIRSSSNRGEAIIDGRRIDTVVDAFSPLILSHLKVTGGGTDSHHTGGGVYSAASHLTVKDSDIVNGRSEEGGGIWVADGATKVVRSTMAFNAVNSSGGGIYVGENGRLTLVSSTVSHNVASSGAGVETDGGAVKLTNDTVDSNEADVAPGVRIRDNGVGALNAVTITHNVQTGFAFSGSALDLFTGGEATMRNSLLAANVNGTSGDDCVSDTPSTMTSKGHNLIHTLNDDCGNEAGPAFHDFTGPFSTPLDLGHLHDNGGPTQTVALGRHSKAVGHAAKSAPARDQRGRKRDGHPDIGAFERGA